MVFIFGLDVPLIEMFSILTVLLIVAIVILVILLRKQSRLENQLDSVLDEEKEIKDEMDLSKISGDKQLMVLKELIGHLRKLKMVGDQKGEQMRRLVEYSGQVQEMSPGPQQERMLQSLYAQLASVDRIVQKESQQLDYIQSLIEKDGQLQDSLAKANKKLERAEALERIRTLR